MATRTPPREQDIEVRCLWEFRRMLEETKKEVREIQATEAQMKWGMAREEKRARVQKDTATADEIRDWRWKLSEDMKAADEERRREERVTDLEYSKAFQEFKRETKVVEKEVDLQYNHEVYEIDRENAAWRVEVAREASERDRPLLEDRAEDLWDMKQARHVQRQQEKADEEANRAHERSLNLLYAARELGKERDRVLQSLELTRAAYNGGGGGGGGGHRRSGGERRYSPGGAAPMRAAAHLY